VVDEYAEMSTKGRAGSLVGAWGIGGVCLLLLDALVRLTPLAIEALTQYELDSMQWAALVIWLGFMGYVEGYRGFQLRFSPRLVARSLYLVDAPGRMLKICAPLVAMGLWHASRRRIIATWCLTLGIVGLILVIRQLDQPWRGMVDAGVVLGLSWGLLSMFWFWARALAGHGPVISLDLPESDTEISLRGRPCPEGKA
jgi:hypothetical protein